MRYEEQLTILVKHCILHNKLDDVSETALLHPFITREEDPTPLWNGSAPPFCTPLPRQLGGV